MLILDFHFFFKLRAFSHPITLLFHHVAQTPLLSPVSMDYNQDAILQTLKTV
jgi:hypothetical protein